MRDDESWKLRFFAIWTGQRLSLIGTQAAQFALVWWVTESTGSAVVLTTASLIALLPSILLGPVVGSLVDRWNRQTVIVVSDLYIALVSLWLAFLFWRGAMQIWHVYVVMLLRSVGSAFHNPAVAASTTLMVPSKHYTRIGGLNQTMAGILSITAPALGALLLALIPLHGIMLVDVATAIFAVSPVLLLGIPQPDSGQVEKIRERSVLANTLEGLHFVIRWPGLLALVGLVLAMKIVIGPAFTLAPLLIMRGFGRDATGLALYQAFIGAGAIAGGLLVGIWGGFKRRILTVLLGLAGMGIGASLVGFAPQDCFWLALVGGALIGGMLATANAPYSAILQATIPPSMQGRVMASLGSLLQLTTPIGLALAGPISGILGIRFWYRFGGIACILIATAGLCSRSLMKLEASAASSKAVH